MTIERMILLAMGVISSQVCFAGGGTIGLILGTVWIAYALVVLLASVVSK